MSNFMDNISNFINDKVSAAEQNLEGFAEKAFLNTSSGNYRTGSSAQASMYESKYRAKALQYPSDLFSNRGIYGDNYVVFYINVPSDSRLLKQPGFETTSVDTTSLRGVTASAGNSAAAVAGATTVASSAAGKLLGLGQAGLGVGALVGGSVGAVAGSDADGNVNLTTPLRQQRRLLETITLNSPSNLNVRYSMNYADDDMAIMNAITDTGGDIAKFAGDAQGGTARTVGGSAGSAATNATSIAAALGFATPGVGGFMSAASGLAANPKKEQVFKNVDFRTFTFEYQFAPRNAKESADVQKIIKTFKLHMHPAYKDTKGYLFSYPSEFDIFYYQGNKENLNVPRNTSCVLTEMSVNYTPNGQFNTFADGSPTQINVNLVFRELAILTQEQIMDGF